MKKSKFLVLGIIALMLAGGLALASCDEMSRRAVRQTRSLIGM